MRASCNPLQLPFPPWATIPLPPPPPLSRIAPNAVPKSTGGGIHGNPITARGFQTTRFLFGFGTYCNTSCVISSYRFMLSYVFWLEFRGTPERKHVGSCRRVPYSWFKADVSPLPPAKVRRKPPMLLDTLWALLQAQANQMTRLLLKKFCLSCYNGDRYKRISFLSYCNSTNCNVLDSNPDEEIGLWGPRGLASELYNL